MKWSFTGAFFMGPLMQAVAPSDTYRWGFVRKDSLTRRETYQFSSVIQRSIFLNERKFYAPDLNIFSFFLFFSFEYRLNFLLVIFFGIWPKLGVSPSVRRRRWASKVKRMNATGKHSLKRQIRWRRVRIIIYTTALFPPIRECALICGSQNILALRSFYSPPKNMNKINPKSFLKMSVISKNA